LFPLPSILSIITVSNVSILSSPGSCSHLRIGPGPGVHYGVSILSSPGSCSHFGDNAYYPEDELFQSCPHQEVVPTKNKTFNSRLKRVSILSSPGSCSHRCSRLYSPSSFFVSILSSPGSCSHLSFLQTLSHLVYVSILSSPGSCSHVESYCRTTIPSPFQSCPHQEVVPTFIFKGIPLRIVCFNPVLTRKLFPPKSMQT